MHWDGERPAYPLSSQRPSSIFFSVDISFKEDIPTIEGDPLGLPEGAVLYTWNGLQIRIRSTKVFVFNAGGAGMLFNRSEETAGSPDAQINSEAGFTKLRQIPKEQQEAVDTFWRRMLIMSPVAPSTFSLLAVHLSVLNVCLSFPVICRSSLPLFHTCRYAAVLGTGCRGFLSPCLSIGCVS